LEATGKSIEANLQEKDREIAYSDAWIPYTSPHDSLAATNGKCAWTYLENGKGGIFDISDSCDGFLISIGSTPTAPINRFYCRFSIESNLAVKAIS
jgi:hypothetical protein